ncbi:MAG TPA: FliM/FliN family flagellar motor switch protein [bacterium]|nr:FliM/FliN family flagellar motor switch protein [bacterium]
MAPRKDITDEDTRLNEDISAFEEFEAGEGSEEPTDSGVAPSSADEPVAEQGEEDLAGFEAPEGAGPLFEEDEAEGQPSKSLADEMASLSPDFPVSLVAVVGKTTTTVRDLINLRLGQAIDLGRAPGETVDLVANGKLIARGELVEMEGKLGVRILKMVR